MADKMVKIELGEGWSVEADPSCWILKETRVMENSKSDVNTYSKATYHPNLEFALRWYADEKLKGMEPTGILKGIKELQASIRKALEDHVAAEGPISAPKVLDKNKEEA